MRAQRILVTGAAGFLGTHLVRNLRRIEREVVATDLTVAEGIISLDVRNKSAVVEMVQSIRPDVIVHLAAVLDYMNVDKYNLYTSNVLGTLNICEGMIRFGIRKLVYLSSTMIHGQVPLENLPITEGTEINPITPYAVSKACGEMIVKEHVMRGGIMEVILRPSIIIGPGQKNNVTEGFIDNALNHVPLEIYGEGNHTREFIFVEDVVNAIINAIDASDPVSGTYLISSGEPIATKDLATKIASMVGDISVRHIASPIHMLSQSYDISRARNNLRWSPRVSLDEGLRATLEWKQKQHELSS
jgi:UDP-glucose 4-epimerase